MSETRAQTPMGKFSVETYIQISSFPERCYAIVYDPDNIQGEVVIRNESHYLSRHGLFFVFSDKSKADIFRKKLALNEWKIGVIDTVSTVQEGNFTKAVLNVSPDLQTANSSLSGFDDWMRVI